MAQPFSQDAAVRNDPNALASTLVAAWSSGDLKAAVCAFFDPRPLAPDRRES